MGHKRAREEKHGTRSSFLTGLLSLPSFASILVSLHLSAQSPQIVRAFSTSLVYPLCSRNPSYDPSGVISYTLSNSISRTTMPDGEPSRTWNQHPDMTQNIGSLLSSAQPQMLRKKTKPIPVTGYDGKAIDEFYDRRPLQVGWRLNSLGFPLLGRLGGSLAVSTRTTSCC
jgi:hypothetical protein